MNDSLWGEEFSLPKASEKTKKIINKISKPKELKVSVEKKIKSNKVSLEQKLQLITENVLKVLGKQKENILVIKTKEQFSLYIDKCIKNGRVAVDTETNNSLDPITCKLMGLCLYTPGEKQVYIPVNHRDPITKERLEWQLTEQDIEYELNRLLNSDISIIMHNGKFDYQVIKCTCNVALPISWDTMIACKLIDENELSAGLKEQYTKKIDPEQEKYSIDNLFEGVEYADVDPEIFAYYAATDSLMTDKLYEYQLNILKQPDFKKVFEVFNDIEMPLVPVIAEMELAGMDVDQEYSKRLSDKYHKKLEDLDLEIGEELLKLKPQIDSWKLSPEANYHPAKKSGEGEGKSKLEQLEDPINLASPTQLAILFYDILKAPQVSKKSPRGTGEDEMKAIAEKLGLPICKLILKRRELVKLLTTYIDTIPELAKRWPDGRVRTHFNQYGAATGRLSSSNPLNFQNIPSHNKEIRLLFKAKEGCKIVGADYSAQEPRLTAYYSQDENMINAYLQGRDLYAVIASMSFDRAYEDCLEFYPEGTKIIYEGNEVITGYKTHQNKEGKTYRTMAKSILLGVLYGRGAASVGEQIGKSRDEAQEIIDKFFKAFPKVKKWIDYSIESCKKVGYVEDIAGRRRRLPDILLEKYEVKYKNPDTSKGDFNPFLGCKNRSTCDKLLLNYKNQLENVKSRKQYEQIKLKAESDGIDIRDNSGFKSQAERQAVNARVQGGAATLTKVALINIYNDERLQNIGAKLINAVHDEILIEVPEENSELAEKLITEIMINSAKKYVATVPMASDTYNVNSWYEDEYSVTVESEFKHLVDDGLNEKDAFNKIVASRTEMTQDKLYNILKGYLKDFSL